MRLTSSKYQKNTKEALKSGLKFSVVGTFIGLQCVLLELYIRSLLSGKNSLGLDLLLLTVFAYPLALILGGIPAFLTGFVLKLWCSNKSRKMIYIHAFWLGALLGSICIYFMFDGKIDSVIYLGLIPSALASVCCSYWFIIPKSLNVKKRYDKK